MASLEDRRDLYYLIGIFNQDPLKKIQKNILFMMHSRKQRRVPLQDIQKSLILWSLITSVSAHSGPYLATADASTMLQMSGSGFYFPNGEHKNK